MKKLLFILTLILIFFVTPTVSQASSIENTSNNNDTIIQSSLVGIPTITSEESIEIYLGESINILDGVQAFLLSYDLTTETDISDRIIVDDHEANWNSPGGFTIYYSVMDDDGNTAETSTFFRILLCRVQIDYLDENGSPIIDSEEINGKLNDPYSISPISIPGYELITEKFPSNSNGTFQKTTNTVKYYYKKKQQTSKVITKFIDENGNELAPSIEEEGIVGELYSTSPITIPNWELDGSQHPMTSHGVYLNSDIIVYYIYKQQTSKVITEFVDENGNQLSPIVVLEGNVGDNYTTQPITIPDWTLDATRLPLNNKGSFTTNDTIVTYVYKKELRFIMTFESNGGTFVESQTVKENEKAKKPPNPSKPGYTFEEWYIDEACTVLYDFNLPVTQNITLYAKWKPIESSDVKPKPPTPSQPDVKPSNPPKKDGDQTKLKKSDDKLDSSEESINKDSFPNEKSIDNKKNNYHKQVKLTYIQSN